MDVCRKILATALLWKVPLADHAPYMRHLNKIYEGHVGCKYRNFYYDTNTYDFVWAPKLTDNIAIAGETKMSQFLVYLCGQIESWNVEPNRSELSRSSGKNTNFDAALVHIAGGLQDTEVYIALVSAQNKSAEWKQWDGKVLALPSVSSAKLYTSTKLHTYFTAEADMITSELLWQAAISISKLETIQRPPHARMKKNVFYMLLRQVMWAYSSDAVDAVFNDMQAQRFGPTKARESCVFIEDDQYTTLVAAYETLEVLVCAPSV